MASILSNTVLSTNLSLCQVRRSASDGSFSDGVSAANKLATETTGRYPVIACQKQDCKSVTVAATGYVTNKWLMVLV